MIIDAHAHIYPPEVIRNASEIGKRERYFARLTESSVHKWSTAEDIVLKMDEHGVAMSWIFGFAFSDLGLCTLCNDYIIETMKRYPGRFIGLAVVPPLSRGAEAEILRCRKSGLSGVGELFPQGQNFDITDARQTWRLAGLLHELKMFLVVHSAEPVGHEYPGKGTIGPREAAEFCSNHPEVRVVFAHFGGGLWMYELMPEMKLTLSNAYYDSAAWPWLYGPDLLPSMVSAGVSDKILYGSDFPILAYPRYAKLLENAAISPQVRERFLFRNALAFLGRVGERGYEEPSL